ncbi:MAG: hypothetical protein CO118_00020 [Flavobacteriales bacterium CG_4_9_14_3_um_filter_32_8]|nr:MAG: hypothetical protein CO118_00020 [Flavobacteriales bacterium CG_4_9_14_3_um_filter_32_8]
MDFLIQKIVSCCNPQQLFLFKNYLNSKSQNLPFQLISCLEKYPDKNINFYSKVVYGTDTKESLKKLNQLNSHTLKLFSFVSQNFPTFLIQNIAKTEFLIFENKDEEALEKLNLLIEIAEKIEDYPSIIQIGHLVKQHFNTNKNLIKKINDTAFIKHAAECVFELEAMLYKQNEVINFNIHEKYEVKDKALNYFRNLFNSNSKSVQIIAKQSYLNILSSTNHKTFYEKRTLALIKETIKQVENNAYLLIAQHKEKIMSLDYMLIKHTRLVLEDKEINQTCSKIISKWQTNYANDARLENGLIFALSIKGSYYITNYFHSKINTKLKDEIKKIVEICTQLSTKINWEKEGYLRYINFYNVFSMFLILNNEEQKGIKNIEKVLHEYQQKSFSKLYDSLFVILIMAYFKANDVEQIINTYSRYKKLTKSKIAIEENDLVIKAIYYCTQLKETNKLQYHKKLENIMKELNKNSSMKNNLLLIQRMQCSIQ